MRTFPLLCAVLLCCATQVFACQECIVLQLLGARLRFIEGPRFADKPDIVLPGAQVRIFRTRRLGEDEQPRQRLSCLKSYDIGNVVAIGKTDKHGLFKLAEIPAGTYWLAVKGKGVHAVYVVQLLDPQKREGTATLTATEYGMVLNKCDIEPIEYFIPSTDD